MNRKLQHSMLALSSTAIVFTMLLLAAAPAPAPQPMAATSLSAGDEAILDAASVLTGGTDEAASQRRHLKHSRALLALPYFSFAQGLRRNRS
ncbi:MAG TPA: hypothetical protein VHL61_05045 [Luteimonas sp.]|nr:hypothetical protein [Luteimonas sp.]